MKLCSGILGVCGFIPANSQSVSHAKMGQTANKDANYSNITMTNVFFVLPSRHPRQYQPTQWIKLSILDIVEKIACVKRFFFLVDVHTFY